MTPTLNLSSISPVHPAPLPACLKQSLCQGCCRLLCQMRIGVVDEVLQQLHPDRLVTRGLGSSEEAKSGKHGMSLAARSHESS